MFRLFRFRVVVVAVCVGLVLGACGFVSNDEVPEVDEQGVVAVEQERVRLVAELEDVESQRSRAVRVNLVLATVLADRVDQVWSVAGRLADGADVLNRSTVVLLGLVEEYQRVVGALSDVRTVAAGLSEEYDLQSERVVGLVAELDAVTAELAVTEGLLEGVEAENQVLLARYDTEIRADLETAVETETERACEEASEPDKWDVPVVELLRWDGKWDAIAVRDVVLGEVEECAADDREDNRVDALRAAVEVEESRACLEAATVVDKPAEEAVRWDPVWEEVTTRARLVRDVDRCSRRERRVLLQEREDRLEEQVVEETERSCVEAAASDSPQQPAINWDPVWEEVTSLGAMTDDVVDCVNERREEFLDGCELIDVGQLKKDPEGNRGECFVMYVNVFQYDSQTGKCGFGGFLSPTRAVQWYDYDQDSTSYFGYAPNRAAAVEVDYCPELTRVDEDDFVRVWATSSGTWDYMSASNQAVTALWFVIEKVELVRKA